MSLCARHCGNIFGDSRCAPGKSATAQVIRGVLNRRMNRTSGKRRRWTQAPSRPPMPHEKPHSRPLRVLEWGIRVAFGVEESDYLGHPASPPHNQKLPRLTPDLGASLGHTRLGLRRQCLARLPAGAIVFGHLNKELGNPNDHASKHASCLQACGKGDHLL